jgi:hypothetical protein
MPDDFWLFSIRIQFSFALRGAIFARCVGFGSADDKLRDEEGRLGLVAAAKQEQ